MNVRCKKEGVETLKFQTTGVKARYVWSSGVWGLDILEADRQVECCVSRYFQSSAGV